jgi:hypothetical protein
MKGRAIAVVPVTAMALVLGLALSLPWLLGFHAEHLYRDAVAELAAAGYRIVQSEYRRDWLESTALLVIAPAASDAEEPPHLQVASRIGHGPGADNLLRWPPVLATARSRITVIGGARQLPPLLMQTALEVGGSMAATLGLPGITYSGHEGSLHLVDGHGELRFGDSGDGWSGRGELPLLEARDVAGKALAIRGLGLRFGLHGLSAGVPVGEGVLTLETLQLDATTDPSPLEVAGVLMRLATAVDAGQARAEAELRIEQLRLNGSAFAPSQLRLVLTGVDAASLSSLLDGLRQLDARDLPESMRGLAIGALLSQSLPGLLSAAPRLDLERLELATPFGAVTADAQLALSASAGSNLTSNPGSGAELAGEFAGEFPPGHPLRWLQRLSGEAQVSAPQALVLQVMIDEQRRRVQRELMNRGEVADPLPARLEEEIEVAAQSSLLSLIRDRWLLSDRGRLSASAVLADGRLTLNGKILPVNGWTGS